MIIHIPSKAALARGLRSLGSFLYNWMRIGIVIAEVVLVIFIILAFAIALEDPSGFAERWFR